MGPATQLGKGKVHAEIYFRHLARQDLNISIGSISTIRVGSSTFQSASSADADLKGSGNGVMARINFQPFENELRFFVVGGASNYDLSIPSGAYSNSYATDNPGAVIGGGLKYVLVPHTVVNPAVSLDVVATHSRYKLTKFNSGDGRVSGDTGFLLTVFELQAAVNVSKKFTFPLRDERGSLEPYAGMKVMRLRTGLDDLTTGAHYSGTRVNYAPFVGLRFKPFPYVGLVAEGSFVGELSASTGLTLGF